MTHATIPVQISFNMRARATVILRRGDNFLVVREKSGKWLLPGGKVENNELPISAATRELFEETSLVATGISFLFEYKSFSNIHIVFSAIVAKTANPKATGEVNETRWISLNEISDMETTPATKKIIDMAIKTPQLSVTD